MNSSRWIIVFIVIFAVLAGLWYLSVTPRRELAEPTSSCVNCHTNLDSLNTAKAKDVEARNYLVKNSFHNSQHGKLACTTCHSGNSKANTKTEAHKGITVDPTADGGSNKCGECHNKITDKFVSSLHYTINGIQNKLITRMSKIENGEQVAKEVVHAKDSCIGCHATCGQCHISEPDIHGGGLLAGHDFVRANTLEHNEKTCSFCHHSIGPDYKTDVHHAQGYSCVQCHNDPNEVHGSGVAYKSMDDKGAITAKCSDCHTDLGGIHKTHMDLVSCSACHAGPYESCYGCHEGDAQKTIRLVRLGAGQDGRITTFTHTPISSDMFGSNLDISQLATKPSWIEITPHTIKAVQSDQEFCVKCHTDNHPKTDDIFLKRDELLFPNVEEKLLVPEGKLPKAL